MIQGDIQCLRHVGDDGGLAIKRRYRLLKNLCLDWLKKKKVHNEIPLEDMDPASPAKVDMQIKISVWNGIEKLPPEQKEIIILRYFHGFSYKEIANLMEKPIGSVMSNLYYAKQNLRKKMERKAK